MNFELTEDQVQVRETVRRLLADRYGTAHRNQCLAEERGWSLEAWRAYVELGLTALLVPAEFDGLGAGPDDLYVVMREFGRAGILEPFLGSCVAGATAISLAGTREQRETYLPAIAGGELVFAWAHSEHQPNGQIRARAEESADGWHVSGLKPMVLNASSADCLIVSACLADAEMPALFVVPRSADGLQTDGYRLIDGSSAGDVRLDKVHAVPLGAPSDGGHAIHRVEQMCLAAICAEAVGAMQAALDLTISYLNTRTQFGKALAANQALRHRCADMAVMLECGDSMAMLAAIAVSSPEDCEPHDLMAARSVVTRCARSLCEQAIQLHGGIGMTDEYGVGRYLQRAMVVEQLFADTVRCMERAAAAPPHPEGPRHGQAFVQ